MSRTNKTTPKVAPDVVEEMNEVMTNKAANLPSDTVLEYSGYKFTIKDFKYKEYMQFVRYMTPLLEAFSSKLTSGRAFSLEGASSGLSIPTVLNFCEESLPKMALLVARHSYPDMEEDELLEIIPSPFEMSELVLTQISHNKIIEKLAAFLQLMTPKRQS